MNIPSSIYVTQVYTKAELTDIEQAEMPSFISGVNEEFYDSPQFEKLYEYLAFTAGLMPYENARGKTATPDDWILEFLALMER